jgi:hypothetical protein
MRTRDDATIRRCIAFAKSHCYGGVEVVNLASSDLLATLNLP